ncbi:MAG TPA: protein translocase subunit SecD, partial [Lacipirellulaceae bacterium]|nr:protein translocase subunit SecD [Lacipirellulaceae bacterium]
MDTIANARSGRWNPWGTALLLVALAVAATAAWSPEAWAQIADPASSSAAAQPGAEAPATRLTDAIETVPGRWQGGLKVLIVISLFVVPIIVGSWLARVARMIEYGWKFAVAIGVLAAAAVVFATGKVKLGPDLSGGITLIYELAEGGLADGIAEDSDVDGAADGLPDGRRGTSGDELISTLIEVLTKRVDPTGTKEVTIRKYGEGQIEIIIPAAEQQELDYIQRRISTAGSLVFRITASRRFDEHLPVIDLAEDLPTGQDIVKLDDKEVARWVALDQTEFPTIDVAIERGLVTRTSPAGPQALVMTDDGLDVTGDFLRSATPDVDEGGRPQVSFAFNSDGAFLFGQLTGQHIPTSTGQRYNLGILLDNRLLSAPTIESKITDRGRISGNMSEAEVNFIVGILQAGKLPAALNKTPISKAQISPTLGAETIEKGTRALIISLALVAIFMIAYYRFAGLVATFALASNMLLIVGAMVLIKGAFTLPGLAGLVLTVGMSVDANVLIYERIREELRRGAALRMAIRNGYDKAMSTIVDSNVTTLITAVVIYKIAPDNVKGFGVTLIIGIVMSLFSAVFLTRIIFDVAERKRVLTKLSMTQIIGETNFDFLRWGRMAITASIAIILVGLAATFGRKNDLLDIDFTGGSSVQFVLEEGQAMPFAEVMEVLKSTDLAEKNLSLVRVGLDDRHYTVSTVNDDIGAVESILADAFRGKLERYDVEIVDLQAIPGAGAQGSLRPGLRMWPGASLPLVAAGMLQADPTSDVAADEAAVQDAADGETEATGLDDVAIEEAVAETEAAAEAAVDEAAAAQTAPASLPAALASSPDESFAGGAMATVKFGEERQADEAGMLAPTGGVSYSAMEQLLLDALKAVGHEGAAYSISAPGYTSGTSRNFMEWTVKVALPVAQAEPVFA